MYVYHTKSKGSESGLRVLMLPAVISLVAIWHEHSIISVNIAKYTTYNTLRRARPFGAIVTFYARRSAGIYSPGGASTPRARERSPSVVIIT